MRTAAGRKAVSLFKAHSCHSRRCRSSIGNPDWNGAAPAWTDPPARRLDADFSAGGQRHNSGGGKSPSGFGQEPQQPQASTVMGRARRSNRGGEKPPAMRCAWAGLHLCHGSTSLAFLAPAKSGGRFSHLPLVFRLSGDGRLLDGGPAGGRSPEEDPGDKLVAFGDWLGAGVRSHPHLLEWEMAMAKKRIGVATYRFDF